jgi:hypothetical protein
MVLPLPSTPFPLFAIIKPCPAVWVLSSDRFFLAQVPLHAGAIVRDTTLDITRIPTLVLSINHCLLTLGLFLTDAQGALGFGLSDSVLSTSASPLLVQNIGSATAISCGTLFNCALVSGTRPCRLLLTPSFASAPTHFLDDRTGKAYCWGTGTPTPSLRPGSCSWPLLTSPPYTRSRFPATYGQLGYGTNNSVGSPVPVQVLTNATNIIAISAGDTHACLIDSGTPTLPPLQPFSIAQWLNSLIMTPTLPDNRMQCWGHSTFSWRGVLPVMGN